MTAIADKRRFRTGTGVSSNRDCEVIQRALGEKSGRVDVTVVEDETIRIS